MSRFFESCLGLIGGLSRQSETFKVMERRLLKAIINPAMIVTWLAGIYLAWAGLWYWSAWFQIKFLLVVVPVGGARFLGTLGQGFRSRSWRRRTAGQGSLPVTCHSQIGGERSRARRMRPIGWPNSKRPYPSAPQGPNGLGIARTSLAPEVGLRVGNL